MPESSDLSLIADRVGKAGYPYALPPVKTYWLWYYSVSRWTRFSSLGRELPPQPRLTIRAESPQCGQGGSMSSHVRHHRCDRAHRRGRNRPATPTHLTRFYSCWIPDQGTTWIRLTPFGTVFHWI
jgi:hypothetical protein